MDLDPRTVAIGQIGPRGSGIVDIDGLIYANHTTQSSRRACTPPPRNAKAKRRSSSYLHDFATRSGFHSAARSAEHREFSILRRGEQADHRKMNTSPIHSIAVLHGGSTYASILAAQRRAPQARAAPPQLDAHPGGVLELRHGRPHIKDSPYPLPVDLAEFNRQNLRTLVATEAFGKALCSPQVSKVKPKRILDLACGTGLWSALCNDYLKGRGFQDVEFIGMDIAPTAPNLSRQGVKWKFVQHDVRNMPLPFEDGYFDLVMIKDSTMIMPLDERSYGVLDEVLRTLRTGGIMEVWESDHVIRSLDPDTPPGPASSVEEQLIADATATFCIPRGHPFVPTSNSYFTQANKWVAEALDWESMMATPCTKVAEMLTQEETLSDHGSRRIAIPFGELKHEQELSDARSVASSKRYNDSMMSDGSREKATWPERTLTADQTALRHTALLTNLQMYQAMEPLLKKASGKTSDEWATWWANMMTEMLGPSKPVFAGECLEIGVFWATKAREA